MLDTVTVQPPFGAAALSVTVPPVETPPATVAGLKFKEAISFPSIDRVAFSVTDAAFATIDAV